MIAAMVGAMRVGLLTRWMGVLGIFTGVLIFLPIGGDDARDRARLLDGTAMGMLYAERWPGGDPPAWTSGEARPWPTRADQRAAQQAGGGKVLAGAGAECRGSRRRCRAPTAPPRASASASAARAAAKDSGRSRPP